MSASEYYKALISEMPHISMDLPDGKHIDFDLELEYVKTIDDLKNLFKRILSGDEIKSRRGLLVKLSTHEEKISFMNEIKDFLTFFLQKKFNTSLVEFYKSLAGA